MKKYVLARNNVSEEDFGQWTLANRPFSVDMLKDSLNGEEGVAAFNLNYENQKLQGVKEIIIDKMFDAL